MFTSSHPHILSSSQTLAWRNIPSSNTKQGTGGCHPGLSESSAYMSFPQSTVIFEMRTRGPTKLGPGGIPTAVLQWESVPASAPVLCTEQELHPWSHTGTTGGNRRNSKSCSQATTQQTRAAPTFPYWANEPRRTCQRSRKPWDPQKKGGQENHQTIAILDPVWGVPSQGSFPSLWHVQFGGPSQSKCPWNRTIFAQPAGVTGSYLKTGKTWWNGLSAAWAWPILGERLDQRWSTIRNDQHFCLRLPRKCLEEIVQVSHPTKLSSRTLCLPASNLH